jgi:hypothetical protein
LYQLNIETNPYKKFKLLMRFSDNGPKMEMTPMEVNGMGSPVQGKPRGTIPGLKRAGSRSDRFLIGPVYQPPLLSSIALH